MSSTTANIDDLLRENADLRARLAEFEETLRALRGEKAGSLLHSSSLLIDELPGMAAAISPEGRILYCNRTFADMVGIQAEKIWNTSLHAYFVKEAYQELSRLLDEAMRHEASATLSLMTAVGRTIPVHLGLRFLGQGESRTGLMTITDATAVRDSSIEASLLKRIAMGVEQAPGLTEAFRFVLREIVDSTGAACGELRLPGNNGEALLRLSATYARVPGMEVLWNSTSGDDPSPGKNLSERALATGQPAWIQDTTLETEDAGLKVARTLGIRSAVAIPLVASGNVVAILVLLSTDKRETGVDRDRLVTVLASQIGGILQRKISARTKGEHERSGQGLSAADREESLRMLLVRVPAILWTVNKDLVYTSIAGSVLKSMNVDPETLLGKRILTAREYGASRESVEAAHRAALAGQPQTYEMQIGSTTLRSHLEPLMGSDGSVSGVVGVALDVSEKRIAEHNLRASYDALESLVDERTRQATDSQIRIESILASITDCYYALDQEWRFVEINDNALKYFGRTREELIGTKITDFAPAIKGSTLEAEYRRALAENKPVRLEMYSLVVDRWADVHVHPLNGKLYVYFSEITARKKAEEAVRESEQRFRNVLENSRDLIFKFDLVKDRFDYLSPSAEAVIGFTTEELKEMSSSKYLEHVHPEDRENIMRNNAILMSSGRENAHGLIEYRWRSKSGAYRWISSSRVAVWDTAGVPVATFGTIRDITEQKELERVLREAHANLELEVKQRREIEGALQSSEARYRAIVESQVDLVCRHDAQGNLTFVNEAYCHFVHRKRGWLIGKAFAAMVHPDDLAMVKSRLALMNQQHSVIVTENRVVSGSGEVHWFQWTNSALFNDQGELIEIQSVGRDFTDRKRTETHLAMQYAISRAMAEATTAAGATRTIMEIICEGLGWDLGIFWRIERPRGLRFETIWHAPNVETVMIEQSQLTGSELPARVLKERRPIWIADLAAKRGGVNPAFAGKGFRSVFAFPVRGSGGILAVIECFSRNVINPGKELLQTLDAIGHQVGNFRDRKTAEEATRRSAEEMEVRVKQRTEQLAGALEALSNSEMRFRAVFEGAPLGIAVLNPEGLIMERNPTLERMLGYSEGSLYGRSFLGLLHPDDALDGTAQFRSLVDGQKKSFRVEHRYIRKDGSILWGSLSGSLMRFEGEPVTYMIAMIKDVTERRQIEQELRESENRFRQIFEESPLGIAVVDERGVFIQENPAFLEMLGYSPEDMAERRFADITHPDDVQADMRMFLELMGGKRSSYQMEKRYIRKNGEITWANVSATLMYPGGGLPPYNLRLVEDITSRKIAEQRLRMLGHTITSMNESVLITDIHYRIISVNKAFLRTFGFTDEEILGKSISALRAPDGTREQMVEMLSRTVSGGWTGELHGTRKNGEVFPMLLSTSVVRDETGKPVAFVGIIRDVTEQKKLQLQLEEAERKRSEDLRRFATSVQRAQEDERQRISRELHDDICQRLSGMKLNMEVLEDEIRPSDKKTSRTLRGFRKQFEAAIAEVRRLSSNLRPTVLDDFGLGIALNLLAREFQKAHKIKVTLEPDGNLVKHLDPQLEIALYRIAQESLTNIAKHARATAVTIRLTREDRFVELSVQDNGTGFNKEEAVQSRKPGHGLGLISMKERAELIGGRFVLESVPGQGTTITVTIPLEVRTDNEENENSDRR